MMSRMEIRRTQRGQAMTEYIAIVSMCMLVLLGITSVFLDKVGEFYLNVRKVVWLPFP